MQDSGDFKELSGMVKKLSDMVASQSQVSQDAIAALEKRLLSRSDNKRRAVADSIRYIIYFLVIVVLVWAAIKFIWGLF